MPQSASYIPRALNLDIDIATLQPGEYTFLLNGRTVSAEKKGSKEDVRGNRIESAFTGVIQRIPNKKGNVAGMIRYGRTLTVLYNGPDGLDGIYQYSEQDDDWTRISEDEVFGFGNKVYHAAIIGDQLIYSVPFIGEIRRIDFSIFNREFQITEPMLRLQRRPPHEPVVVGGEVRNSQVNGNRVNRDTYQFAYRYVYEDDSLSVFSPWSTPHLASTSPSDSDSLNELNLYVDVPEDIHQVVKAVEIAFRKNDDTQGYLVNRFDVVRSGITTIGFTATENTTPLPDDEWLTLFHNVPKAHTLTVSKNHLLLGNLEFGLTTNGTSLRLDIEKKLVRDNEFIERHGSMKRVGVVMIAENGYMSGVQADELFTTAYQQVLPLSTGEIPIGWNKHFKQRMNVTVTGRLPSWVRYLQLAVTEDLATSIYCQVPVIYYFYVADAPADENFTPEVTRSRIEGKQFLTYKPTSRGDFSYLYLQVPDNIPIEPDGQMYVRLLDLIGQKVHEEPVLAVVGNMVVVNDFGITNFSNLPPKLFVEFYKRREEVSDTFYLTGKRVPVAGNPVNVTIELPGQDHMIPIFDTGENNLDRYWKFDQKVKDYNADNFPGYINWSHQGNWVYSPSPTYHTKLDSSEVTLESKLQRIEISKKQTGWFIFKKTKTEATPVYQTQFKSNRGYTLDYTKTASGLGLPVVKIDGSGVVDLPAGIAYTDVLREDSTINNLGVIPVANLYLLSEDRGRIVKMVTVQEVVLCLHEHNVSTLYIGNGQVEFKDVSLLAKTENVIGDDRPLRGDYGCQHEESVDELDGQVFWYDDHRGAVLRYTTEGIYPVSNNGLYFHFLKKTGKYAKTSVYGVIDPKHKQYIITFPTVALKGEDDLAAETLVFDIQSERWEGWQEWTKDDITQPVGYRTQTMAAYVGSQLFVAMQDQLWRHNTGEYLNFFGKERESILRIPMSPEPNLVKDFLAVHIHADSLGAIASGETVLLKFTTNLGQESYLPYHLLELEEGVYKAEVMRDIKTPGYENQPVQALYEGQVLKGEVMEVELISRGETGQEESSRLRRISMLFIPSPINI